MLLHPTTPTPVPQLGKYQTSTQLQFVLHYPRPSYLHYIVVFAALSWMFYKSYLYWSISVGFLSLVWIYHYLVHVHTEWVFLLRGVGLAFGSISLVTSTNEFYPLKDILDCIVHEVIQRFQCRFYLAVLVHRPKPIRLLFQRESLSLKSLQWILREIHSFLKQTLVEEGIWTEK